MCKFDIKHHNSWDKFLKDSKELDKTLKSLNSLENICPLKNNVFRFLNTNLSIVKCIILGMDPYPSTYLLNKKKVPVATGRAFEISNSEYFTDKYKQSSLTNIFKALWYYKYNEILSKKEIIDKIKERSLENLKIKDWFDRMESKGVIFLNATLTVKEGKPNSHKKLWNPFMNELMAYLSSYKDIKWLIWGQTAYDRVLPYIDIKNIVYSCHPSARANNDFVKDCCFKKVNNIIWF